MKPDLQMSDETSEKTPRATTGAEQGHPSRDPTVTRQLDTVYECLRFSRSRYLLYHLAGTDDRVSTVEEAATAVQEYEATGPETTERPSKQSVRIDLINGHCPRLQAARVLTHDPQSGEIHFAGTSLLTEWLERSYHREID